MSHSPDTEVDGEPAPAEDGALGADLMPERIGPYKPLETIGSGGMGIVYLAEQTVPVHRRVALKLIKLGMDTREVVARFEAERQILALLDHPNVARVLEAGASADGRPYFVMEYVPGLSITRYCDDARLDLRARLDLFVTVCEAVQFAHQKGIIHRDIKPSNILVEVVADRPIPKIIDFGVAKATGQRLTDRTLYTERGQLLGTPEYMSPEQAISGALDVDTRTDIYSLGVVLYELLAGSLPFDSKTLRQGGQLEIEKTLREVEPQRPSLRLRGAEGEQTTRIAAQRRTTAPALLQSVRGDLDWIVMKAIEKERARRYSSASELAEDVRRYLRDDPVLARPATMRYRFGKLVRRHRTAAIGVAAVAIALVAGIVGTTWQAVRATHAEREARTQAGIAGAVNAFLTGMLAEANPSKNPEGATLTVREMLDRAAREVEGRFDGSPLVEAEIRTTIGNAYRDLVRLDEADAQIRRAIEILRREEPGGTRLAVALRVLATTLRDSARYDEAEHAANETLAIQRAAFGDAHPETAITRSELAWIFLLRGDQAQGESLLREAEAAARSFAARDPSSAASVFARLALALSRRARYDDAERLHREAIELFTQAHGERHPFVLDAWAKLAIALHALGRLEEAERVLRRSLDVQREVFGPTSASFADDLSNLAQIETTLGRLGDADGHLTEALEIVSRTLGAEHPMSATLLDNLAQVRGALGRKAEAEALYQQSLALSTKVKGEEHEDVTATMNNLAALLRETGQYAEAEALFRKVLERFRKQLGEQHPRVAIAIHNLGRTLVDLRELGEAEPLLRDAAARSEGLFPAENVNRQIFKSSLGLCLARAQRFEEAEALLVPAHAAIESKLGPDHLRTKQVAGYLEELYTQWGRGEAASTWRTRAAPSSTPNATTGPAGGSGF